MTKPKESHLGKRLAQGSVTHILSTTIAGLATNPRTALYHFPDDAELAGYVDAGNVPMIAARLVELTIKLVPAQAAKFERATSRGDSVRRRAEAKRAAALKKLDRLMAAKDRTRTEALRDGWPDKDERDRVRKWDNARHRA